MLSANIYSQVNSLDTENWGKVEIENLGIINSPAEEFSPHIWSNYLVYIGVQERAGFKPKGPEYFDIKASLLLDSTDLQNFVFNTELNSNYHEGPLSWDQQSNKLYFTRATVENNQPLVDSKGRQLLQIYQAEYTQGKWLNISKMNFCTEEENYCHPACFNNGRSLIFASTIEGGNGKMDLYRTDKISELTWSTPQNLGKQINNPGNDWFPFVHEDVLYYATDVKDGNGLDIYSCKLNKDGKTTEINRLPPPINSDHDDFGLVISDDNKIAYFSSNRPGGKGKDDVYKVIFPNGMTSMAIPKNPERKENSITPSVTNSEITNTPNSTVTISIANKVSKAGVPDAEIIFYLIPQEVVENFENQLSTNSDIQLLESMASNVAAKKVYKSNANGKLVLDSLVDGYLFIVVKKEAYATEWDYIQAGEVKSELRFEMSR